MPIVVYSCDTCKRSIELQQNPKGLERISRCTITNGCRGKLFQEQVLLDFVRGQRPDSVAGLDDHVPRRVLFNHEQTIARDEWDIIHDLGTSPSVQVFVDRPTSEDPDNQIEILEQDQEIVGADRLILRFDRPETGKAQLIARQSDPILLRPLQPLFQTTEDPQRLTTSGELTLATRDSTVGTNAIITVQLEFQVASGGGIAQFTYAADDQPSINSPWIGVNKVLIKGKTYTVRSFAMINAELLLLTTNGSTFRFIGYDPLAVENFQPFNIDDAFILLADPPFESVDIITDSAIDVTSVSPTSNPFAFALVGTETVADPVVVKRIFPLIRPAS